LGNKAKKFVIAIESKLVLCYYYVGFHFYILMIWFRSLYRAALNCPTRSEKCSHDSDWFFTTRVKPVLGFVF